MFFFPQADKSCHRLGHWIPSLAGQRTEADRKKPDARWTCWTKGIASCVNGKERLHLSQYTQTRIGAREEEVSTDPIEGRF